MQYGLALPNGGVCGDPRVLAELGCLAEEAAHALWSFAAQRRGVR